MTQLEVKDVSYQYRTYGADGGGDDHWVEEYVVLHKGYELLRTSSLMTAERFAARLNNAWKKGSAVRAAREARRSKKVA